MEAAAESYTSIIFTDALSKAEPRLSGLQKAMLDATPDCIKVLSSDGRLLTMNKAGCVALNVPADSAFGMPWLPLLPEEVRQQGLEALRCAAEGQNARFPGLSRDEAGTRYWDNLLTPITDASGQVQSILCVSRDVTAKTQLETELEEAIRREKLLSREMQHRIKNLFAVVTSLLSLSEREAKRDGAPATSAAIFREKIGALSRVSDTVFSGPDADGFGPGGIAMASVVGSVLRPYGERCQAEGDGLAIPRNNTTTLTLLLHEFATNSMKYGALGMESGRVNVRWKAADEGFEMTWTESGGPLLPTAPDRLGFGTEMVDRIVQAAHGKITRSWLREGFAANLYLPNQDEKAGS